MTKSRIQNPLSGIDVEKFATEKDLPDYLALLQKGALVAPTNYEDITGEHS